MMAQPTDATVKVALVVVSPRPKVSLVQVNDLFAPTCACAEITRVAIGPFEVPIGLTPIMVGVVAAAMLPGIILGAVRRARFASALRSAASEPRDVAGRSR